MFKLTKVFFYLILCTFAYAADGLTLYTDPDFPDFSFEYDPSVWTIEQQTFNPVTSGKLKVVTAKNQNGEKLIFSFAYPQEIGFAEECEVILREDQVSVVGDIALRFTQNAEYYPQFHFTLCETDPRGCEERQQIALEFQFPPSDNEVIAVGCRIGFFETEPSSEFIETRRFSSEVAYLESFGEPGYGDSHIWLDISVEPVGLESYQADELISTMTY